MNKINMAINDTAITANPRESGMIMAFALTDGKESNLQAVSLLSEAVMKQVFKVTNSGRWEDVKGSYVMVTVNEQGEVESFTDILGVSQVDVVFSEPNITPESIPSGAN